MTSMADSCVAVSACLPAVPLIFPSPLWTHPWFCVKQLYRKFPCERYHSWLNLSWMGDIFLSPNSFSNLAYTTLPTCHTIINGHTCRFRGSSSNEPHVQHWRADVNCHHVRPFPATLLLLNKSTIMYPQQCCTPGHLFVISRHGDSQDDTRTLAILKETRAGRRDLNGLSRSPSSLAFIFPRN